MSGESTSDKREHANCPVLNLARFKTFERLSRSFWLEDQSGGAPSALDRARCCEQQPLNAHGRAALPLQPGVKCTIMWVRSGLATLSIFRL